MDKQERAHYFSSTEQDLLLKSYEEEKSTLASKSNTVRASKQRKEAWQRIAEKINVENASGCKRTWQQVKNKYKNIMQTAKRRGVGVTKGEGAPANSEPAASPEGLMLHHNDVIPASPCVDALPGCGASYISMTGHPVLVLNAPKTEQGSLSCDETYMSDSHLEEEVKHSSSQDWINTAGGATRRSGAEGSAEDIRTLYCHYLRKEMESRDQEMAYRALKMRKLEKEILLLDKQLE
ncbi:uncharacterized protein LOC143003513 [Genypterus blacodes]|uniref:uncharacterized protein LOC143003513 n=1 Tax=Genypterus blacodes TaxID=154954 RepID=UPI003F75D368